MLKYNHASGLCKPIWYFKHVSVHYTINISTERCEMTSDAPTNAGKYVSSNNACARCQRYTDESVILLVQGAVSLTHLSILKEGFTPILAQL